MILRASTQALILPLLLGSLLGIVLPKAATAQPVDLVLNVVASPDPINAGGTVTYAVRVTNNDAVTTATGVGVDVELPAGLIYEGFSGAGVACAGLAEESPGPGTLVCTLPSIAPDQDVEFDVLLRTTLSGSYDVEFSAEGDQPDPLPGNNAVTQTTTVLSGSDLSVELTGPATAASGSMVAYEATVENLGPDPTSGPITLTIPATAGWAVQAPLPAGCGLAGGIITCTIAGPIAVSGSVVVGPFTGQITVASPSTVNPVASVVSSQDPIAENNTSTIETEVTEGQ